MKYLLIIILLIPVKTAFGTSIRLDLSGLHAQGNVKSSNEKRVISVENLLNKSAMFQIFKNNNLYRSIILSPKSSKEVTLVKKKDSQYFIFGVNPPTEKINIR